MFRFSPTSPNPFAAPGVWYKGNIHTHTTESDGDLAPEQVIEWYSDHGYQFLAITDHDHVTLLNMTNRKGHRPEGEMLLLPGAELSAGQSNEGSPVHVVAIGLEGGAPPVAGFPGAAAALTWAREHKAFAVLAHPYWSGFSTDELAAVPGLKAIEAFNYGCQQENRKGDARVYWDDLLRRGIGVWGVATDDSHWWEPSHAGGGWVMAKCPELSAAAIMHSLRNGLFYSTNGPVIEDIGMKHGRLQVRSSPAAAIYWIGPGHTGWSVHAGPGEIVTQAEFRLHEGISWLRVEVDDWQGHRAWSNPLFLEEG
ncbi:MAG: CehA/McbA family metallohydrolase [Chloroflexi bacterium]|nr:CehA/McbA family metallohydrolase [Chloroflexota bacterium]